MGSDVRLVIGDFLEGRIWKDDGDTWRSGRMAELLLPAEQAAT